MQMYTYLLVKIQAVCKPLLHQMCSRNHHTQCPMCYCCRFQLDLCNSLYYHEVWCHHLYTLLMVKIPKSTCKPLHRGTFMFWICCISYIPRSCGGSFSFSYLDYSLEDILQPDSSIAKTLECKKCSLLLIDWGRYLKKIKTSVLVHSRNLSWKLILFH